MGALQKNQQQIQFCLVPLCNEDDDHHKQEQGHDLEMIMEGENEDTSSSSSFTGSDLSSSSSLSSDLSDDASSNGASFDLSDLMSQLPIKRGLSKFYQGKSQSFTSLARVTSLEDLAKESDGGYGKRLKACRSYGSGLNLNTKQKSSFVTSPKSRISKKSSSMKGKIALSGKPPLGPVSLIVESGS